MISKNDVWAHHTGWVGLHHGSALSPLMFVVGMGRLTDEVRLKSPWTLMFPEGIVISSESREQVEGVGLYAGEKRNENQ